MADDFRAYMEPVLEILDESFAARQVRLSDRPLRAALEFAEEFVLDVSEGTKADPVGQRWFDAVFREARRWYDRRYGKAMLTRSRRNAFGLVMINGVPFRVVVPLTVITSSENPGQRWVHFPDAVREDEDPIDFIDGPIRSGAFPVAMIRNLRENLFKIVASTRTLCTALMTADLAQADRSLVARLLPALQYGIDLTVSDDPERRGLAVWQFNLTAELALRNL